MVMSRTEDDVDKRDNPDSLFAKMLYLIERLPGWMRPEMTRTHMHLYNHANRSVIDGEATGPDSGRGGRRAVILLDEFAAVDRKEKGLGGEILKSTRNMTNCRIFNSTPQGQDNAFYMMRESDCERLTLHWSVHPHKRRGLYRVDDDGNVEIIDSAWHEANPGYAFVDEPGGWEGLRSPYYDRQCERAVSPHDIAQEEDINYLGSGSPFFDELLLRSLERRYSRNPLAVGRIGMILPGCKVRDRARRPLRLWYQPDAGLRPPQNTRYAIACDISTGTGASDSTIAVIDATIREKVAEYVTNDVTPEDLADLAVDLAEYFTTVMSKAYLMWDANGPGAAFGKRVVEYRRYDYVYYYSDRSDRKKKRASKAGWPSNRERKLSLFVNLRAALKDGTYRSPSKDFYSQCGEYVYDGNNGIQHRKSKDPDNPSANKDQHGDVAMSEALGVEAMSNIPAARKTDRAMPISCLAQRNKERQMTEARKRREWWNANAS